MSTEHELPGVPEDQVGSGEKSEPKEINVEASSLKLKPGDTITLGDFTDFVAFEDAVANLVYPEHNLDLWANRPPMIDLVKPARFNGTLANINLVVMDNPYERLLDADKRGWRGQRGQHFGRSSYQLSEEIEKVVKPSYYGFTFIADAKSTGRGVVGQIQTELWYYRLSPARVKAGTTRVRTDKRSSGEVHIHNYIPQRDLYFGSRSSVQYGKEINRVVARPRLEQANFIAIDAESRRIGVAELRRQVANPILTPTGGKQK